MTDHRAELIEAVELLRDRGFTHAALSLALGALGAPPAPNGHRVKPPPAVAPPPRKAGKTSASELATKIEDLHRSGACSGLFARPSWTTHELVRELERRINDGSLTLLPADLELEGQTYPVPAWQLTLSKALRRLIRRGVLLKLSPGSKVYGFRDACEAHTTCRIPVLRA